MTPRITLAVAVRVLTQLRRDPRTIGLLLVLPCLLITLMWWIYQDSPGDDATSPTSSAQATTSSKRT